MGDTKDSTVRRVLRAIGWSISVPWAALWTLAGIATGLDPSYETSLPAGLAVAGIVGCLPWLPFWIAQRRRRRRAKTPAPIRNEPVPRVAPAQHGDQRLAQLPVSIRDEWRRLEHARDLVHGFAEDGWVERAALLDVDDHMARLKRLLEADERTNRLGGASSSTLRRQVEELTALLVALADEAVEHQASLADDDPVPVTLAEAKERLSATARAYRDLRPSETRRTEQPDTARRIEQPEASPNLRQPG